MPEIWGVRLLGLLLTVLVLATAVLLRRAAHGCSPEDRGARDATLIALLLVLAMRLATDIPAFLHANLHGPGLLDGILGFPQPPHLRAEYGPGSFYALGAVAALLGRRWEVVVATNQVLGVVTLGLVAWCTAIWTGKPKLAPLLVVLAACTPALTRVAASEDAHVVATACAWLGLLGMERYGQDRARADLLVGVTAMVWMLLSRQTLLPWTLLVFALPVVRHRRLLRDPGFRAAIVVIASTLLTRLAVSIDNPMDRKTYVLGSQALVHLASVMPALVYHPLIAPAHALVGLPLLLLGLPVLVRRVPGGAWLAWTLLGFFVVTWPLGVPTDGTNLGFRYPLVMLATVPQALGADQVLRWLTSRWASPWAVAAQGLAALSMAAMPVLLPGWTATHRLAPLDLEYRYLRTWLPRLPAGAVLATLALDEPAPSWRLPQHLLNLRNPPMRNLDVQRLRPIDLRGAPVYALLGVACRARSVEELWPDFAPARDILALLAAAYARKLPAGVRDTSDLRPECAGWLSHTHPGTLESLVTPQSENPFSMMGQSPVRIGLQRLVSLPDGGTVVAH